MKKLLKYLDKFEEIVSCTAFSVMVLAIVFNVFLRYLTNKSLKGAEEISYLGFTWAVFFGICSLYKNNALIAIGVVVDRLAVKSKRRVHIFTFALVTISNVIMIYYSATLAVQAWDRPTSSLRIPYFFMDIPATIAFIILTYYSLRFLIMAFKGKTIEEANLEDQY